MTILSIATQSRPALEAPTEAMVVKLADSLGVAAKGEAVTWTVAAGGGSVQSFTATTDSLGRAFALWTLGATTATQQLIASHARVAKPATFSGTVPVGSVAFAPAATRQYVGDTVSVAATVKDTKGTVLTGAPNLVVRDTTVAVRIASGALVGRGDGAAWVVAVAGPLNTPKDSVRMEFFRELRGTVYTYDGSPLPPMRAYSRNGAVTDSVDVTASGTFRLKLTSHATGWASEVLIDAVNKSGRAWFPALMPVATDCSVRALPNCVGSDINADISFVLVPTQYRVTRGIYAGRTLAVNLNLAMATSTGTGPSYLFTSGNERVPITSGGAAPALQNTYAAAEMYWLPDSFPIGVAIHRACCSARTVVADDSVQVMRALTTVQNTLGFQIWTPVNDRADYKTDRVSATTPNRMLIFQFDSQISGAVTGGGGTGPIAAGTSSPAVLMLQDFVVTGWRGSAVDHVTVSNTMSQAQVIGYNPNAGALRQEVLIHEAMHTLGAGHGCAWASTQSYCGLAPGDTLPSFEDAAYLLLAMEVKAAAWRNRALHGLTAALFGQRAIMLGVDPVPAPWTMTAPSGVAPSDLRRGSVRGMGRGAVMWP
ncbi:MAG: hypothetical protein Q8K55_12850 [Gemmatimonadaceae bacterium]|nr:hypothetical protein [Gemmatimonadaceae bacterium]